jgi:hypothetical protein
LARSSRDRRHACPGPAIRETTPPNAVHAFVGSFTVTGATWFESPANARRSLRAAIVFRRTASLPLLACWIVLSVPLARAACDDPPPPVRDVIADRFYVDSASSVADKAIIARNKNALATLDHTLVTIIAMEDKALAGDAASAACAGRWLVVWAKGGAMLGHMSSQQAVIERK